MSRFAGVAIAAVSLLVLPAVSQAESCPPNIINGMTVAMSSQECAAWTAAQPSPAQTAKLAARSTAMEGIQIVSKSTPALNSTYPIDLEAQLSVQSEQLSILSQKTFSNGATSIAWLDSKGESHTFPTVAAFSGFAKVYRAYVTQLKLGHTPTNPVTIP